MNFGFAEFGLSEMVSFTAEVNLRSRAVMERLGMKHDPADDFDDSSLGVGDRLRRHVLYRLAHPDRWEMSDVRFGIVEGEPGIFPDPIARLFRLVGRVFRPERQRTELRTPNKNTRLTSSLGSAADSCRSASRHDRPICAPE